MSKNSEYEPAVIYTNQSRTFQKRRRLIDILALLFGISSYIGISSAYSQWALIGVSPIQPKHTLFIIIATTAIALFYVIHQRYATQKCDETRVIYVAVACNCLAALGMALFHRWTIQIDDTIYYLAFLICTFVFSLIGALSMVLFVPWMGRFRECYLMAFTCGQSLCEIIPFTLRCLQGVTNAPINYANVVTNSTHPMATLTRPILHFTSEQYFFMVFGFVAVGGISFLLLEKLRISHKEFAPGNIIQGNEYYYNDCDKYDIASGKIPESSLDLSVLKIAQLLVILIVMGILLNCINPILMVVSASSYGQHTFDSTLEAIAIACPVAWIFAFFMPHTSIHWVEICSCAIVVIIIFIVNIAMKSPVPPFIGTFWGSFIIVGYSTFSPFALV